MPGEAGVGLEGGGGDALRDGGDLLAGGAFGRGGSGVVDVVDVAAGAVAHDADEGGFSGVTGVGGVEARGEFAGEGGEVVGGDRGQAADVVQAVVGEHGERAAVGFGAGGEERDIGVHGAGGPSDLGVFVSGIHPRAVGGDFEGISVGFARFDEPAAIEDLIGVGGVAEGDLGGFEIGVGADDAFGDARGEISEVDGVGVALKNGCERRARVRMRGADEEMRGGNTGGAGGDRLGGLANFTRDHARIDDTEDEGGGAALQREAARVHRIGDGAGERALHAAVDRGGELGRGGGDVLREGAGADGGG